MTRRKIKKQRKIIILTSISVLFILTVGYAAFNTNLNITAKGNIVYKTKIYVSNLGSDENGTGSRTKPFQTIQKAYDTVKTEATIYIMNDIEINTKINFSQNKNIILTSDNESSQINSLIRKEELSYLLEITNGETTIQNIIFDGKNIVAQGALLRIANNAILNLNEGSVFQNNIDTSDSGGGIMTSASTVNINGSKIINNTANGGGGGGIVSNYTKMIINDVEISGNTANNGAGIYFGAKDGELAFNNGKIINNTATSGSGGGIVVASSTLIMNGGEISNNQALKKSGGGITVEAWGLSKDIKGTFIMKGGTISNNTAQNGGGIYIGEMGIYEYHNGTITDNNPNDILDLSSQ